VFQPRRTIALLFSLAACTPETSVRPDADPNDVVKHVACGGVTPAVTITTVGLAFAPQSSTIAVDAVVRFELPPQHDVASATTGLAVDFGETACLQFPIAGRYAFACESHQFTGSIVVE
jgi:plastocyanin